MGRPEALGTQLGRGGGGGDSGGDQRGGGVHGPTAMGAQVPSAMWALRGGEMGGIVVTPIPKVPLARLGRQEALRTPFQVLGGAPAEPKANSFSHCSVGRKALSWLSGLSWQPEFRTGGDRGCQPRFLKGSPLHSFSLACAKADRAGSPSTGSSTRPHRDSSCSHHPHPHPRHHSQDGARLAPRRPRAAWSGPLVCSQVSGI